VVIVDENMEMQLWPKVDPIGKRIHRGGMKTEAPWMTVVGVVRQVKHETLDSDPRIAFYLPQTQATVRTMSVVVRSTADPGWLTSAVRNEIRELDPDLPMFSIQSMERRVGESLARRRFAMALLGVLAGIAFALASIGIYGVMAYQVNQGTREMGIRIALGATHRGIVTLVLRQGLTLAAGGVLIGLAGAAVLPQFLRSLLFGVGAMDGLTFLTVSVLLVVVALVASYVPARRAARLEPAEVLRNE
jgi:ABC-type antimicrobial peptide transport system permease subunit